MGSCGSAQGQGDIEEVCHLCEYSCKHKYSYNHFYHCYEEERPSLAPPASATRTGQGPWAWEPVPWQTQQGPCPWTVNRKGPVRAGPLARGMWGHSLPWTWAPDPLRQVWLLGNWRAAMKEPGEVVAAPNRIPWGPAGKGECPTRTGGRRKSRKAQKGSVSCPSHTAESWGSPRTHSMSMCECGVGSDMQGGNI